MKKYYCDRCGKEVKESRPFVVAYELVGFDERITESKDLCGSCYDEFISFIEGGDKDEINN